MVIRRISHSERGMLMVDLAVATAIFVAVLLPLSMSFLSEQKLVRAYYFRALATEIVDGEMETLAAGEWRATREGAQQPYEMRGSAVTNLPAGKFIYSRTGNKLRLEWRAEGKDKAAKVVREAEGR